MAGAGVQGMHAGVVERRPAWACACHRRRRSSRRRKGRRRRSVSEAGPHAFCSTLPTVPAPPLEHGSAPQRSPQGPSHSPSSFSSLPLLPRPPRSPHCTGPRGRRGDMASGVVLMHRDDLQRVAPLWLHYSEVCVSCAGAGGAEHVRGGKAALVLQVQGTPGCCCTAVRAGQLAAAVIVHLPDMPVQHAGARACCCTGWCWALRMAGPSCPVPQTTHLVRRILGR